MQAFIGRRLALGSVSLTLRGLAFSRRGLAFFGQRLVRQKFSGHGTHNGSPPREAATTRQKRRRLRTEHARQNGGHSRKFHRESVSIGCLDSRSVDVSRGNRGAPAALPVHSITRCASNTGAVP